MPRIGQFEVKIKVEDTYPLEYDDDDDEAEASESVTTKYIEAVSGAKFGISCKVLPGYHFNEDFLSFQVFLDGQRAGGKHFLKEKHNNRRGEAGLVARAFMYGKDYTKSLTFRFANLETRKSIVLYFFLGILIQYSPRPRISRESNYALMTWDASVAKIT
jgi:hypothetical protein